MNRDLVVKLLNLSTSENDNEALLAVRRANDIVRKAGQTWERLIAAGDTTSAGRQKSKAEYQYGEPRREYWETDGSEDDGFYEDDEPDCSEVTIETMLKTCIERVRNPRALDFLRSLDAQYKIRGKLTDKQIEALRKFYANCF